MERPVYCLLSFCDLNGSHISHTIVHLDLADPDVTMAQMVFAPEDIRDIVSASWDRWSPRFVRAMQ
jgi:hypothetical protein